LNGLVADGCRIRRTLLQSLLGVVRKEIDQAFYEIDLLRKEVDEDIFFVDEARKEARGVIFSVDRAFYEDDLPRKEVDEAFFSARLLRNEVDEARKEIDGVIFSVDEVILEIDLVRKEVDGAFFSVDLLRNSVDLVRKEAVLIPNEDFLGRHEPRTKRGAPLTERPSMSRGFYPRGLGLAIGHRSRGGFAPAGGEALPHQLPLFL